MFLLNNQVKLQYLQIITLIWRENTSKNYFGEFLAEFINSVSSLK